ncbi:hypothetical protein [Acrocarpospora sp. B8E8]|uniref:hypothetical protein n=1 Tax=Acrocarpospora sp. B8E8 TaxID=3153572 RepID=UPI00325CEC2F
MPEHGPWATAAVRVFGGIVTDARKVIIGALLGFLLGWIGFGRGDRVFNVVES